MADGSFYSRIRLKATKGPCVVDREVARTMAMDTKRAQILVHQALSLYSLSDPTVESALPLGTTTVLDNVGLDYWPTADSVSALVFAPIAVENTDTSPDMPLVDMQVGIVVGGTFYPFLRITQTGTPQLLTIESPSQTSATPLYIKPVTPSAIPIEYILFEVT